MGFGAQGSATDHYYLHQGGGASISQLVGWLVGLIGSPTAQVDGDLFWLVGRLVCQQDYKKKPY